MSLAHFMATFFSVIELLERVLWDYAAIGLIFTAGAYLTLRSRFYQIRVLFKAKTHISALISAGKEKAGIHPIQLYFASIGGMLGLGNLVSIMTTVTIGGPGSLVWLWITSFAGMIIKYSEIYLGIKYRVPHKKHGFDGGPMYYLEVAFNNKILPTIFCILLCIYGVEVFQFLTIADIIKDVADVSKETSILILLCLVLLSAIGGVKRLAAICSTLMPPFIITYLLIGLWIIIDHWSALPSILASVFSSAFTGHAAVGGFVGSTMILAAHHGVSRAVYSGDIGLGYDATVQSETKIPVPEEQARIAIFSLFSDAIICTTTILIVLCTGVWKIDGMQLSEYLPLALSNYVPYVKIFTSLLFFVAGFVTITAYLVVGQKCAAFLSPKFGKRIYMAYAIFAFIFFSFYDQTQTMTVMSLSGAALVICNVLGILKLSKEVKFI